jgi:hypothetical protein
MLEQYFLDLCARFQQLPCVIFKRNDTKDLP